MAQLTLTPEQLEEIGFTKKVHPAIEENPERTTYEVKCLNGIFYYNVDFEHYRWYQKIIIGDGANHINLKIEKAPELFTILQCFQIKHTLVII